MARRRRTIKKKRNRKSRQFNVSRVIFLFLIILFIGTVGYVFVFSNFLAITKVEVLGNKKIKTESILEKINGKSEGKYWNIFPKNNFLYIRNNDFEEMLKKEFHRIDDIAIEKEFPNKLEIKIIEKEKILLWCSQGECYFLDKDGVISTKFSRDDAEVYKGDNIKIIDQSQFAVSEEELILNPKRIKFILQLANRFTKETGIIIGKEYRMSSRDSEDVIVQTDKGWDIYFNTSLSLKKTIRVFKTVLSKKFNLDDLYNLEYVDLRFKNKVFYRLKDKIEKELGEEENNNSEKTDKEKDT